MFNIDNYYGVAFVGFAILIVFISYLIWGLKAARVNKVDTAPWKEDFWADGLSSDEISEELTAVMAENHEKMLAQKANTEKLMEVADAKLDIEKSNKELADEIAQKLENSTADLEDNQIIADFESKFVNASEILETTAKFRTFVAGEEVTPVVEEKIPVDYTQSFERIKASLDAQAQAIDQDIKAFDASVNIVNINDLEETAVISRDDIVLADNSDNNEEKNVIEEIAPVAENIEETKFFDEHFMAEMLIDDAKPSAVANTKVDDEVVSETSTMENSIMETSIMEDENGRIRTDLTVEEALSQTFGAAQNEPEQDLEATMVIPTKPVVVGGLADLAVAAVAEKHKLDLALPTIDEDADTAQNILPEDLEDTLHVEKIADIPEKLDVLAMQKAVFAPVKTPEMLPEKPIPFGSKMAWLAIPGFMPSEVIASLKLQNVEPANWSKGLKTAYEGKNQVFVTPLLRGWTLVIGKVLWSKADLETSVENITWFREIGRAFGNACFYSTMDSLGNHAWVGLRDGSIVRAYGYSGELSELVWQLGEPTDEELELDSHFADQKFKHGAENFVVPDEKMVMKMADLWSIDPTFSDAEYPADMGFVATMR